MAYSMRKTQILTYQRGPEPLELRELIKDGSIKDEYAALLRNLNRPLTCNEMEAFVEKWGGEKMREARRQRERLEGQIALFYRVCNEKEIQKKNQETQKLEKDGANTY